MLTVRKLEVIQGDVNGRITRGVKKVFRRKHRRSVSESDGGRRRRLSRPMALLIYATGEKDRSYIGSTSRWVTDV
jgi:hypothetical protein